MMAGTRRLPSFRWMLGAGTRALQTGLEGTDVCPEGGSSSAWQERLCEAMFEEGWG